MSAELYFIQTSDLRSISGLPMIDHRTTELPVMSVFSVTRWSARLSRLSQPTRQIHPPTNGSRHCGGLLPLDHDGTPWMGPLRRGRNRSAVRYGNTILILAWLGPEFFLFFFFISFKAFNPSLLVNRSIAGEF